jgi:hypothetical protein
MLVARQIRIAELHLCNSLTRAGVYAVRTRCSYPEWNCLRLSGCAPQKSVGIFGFPMTFLRSCRPERRDGRFRFTARQVGSEATAGRQWPRISSKPPQPQTKPGPHTINFTDQGPPKGERTMIETPVLILIVVMAIGAIVWWRATAH